MNTIDRRWLWLGAALLLVALLIAPFLIKNYRVFQLTSCWSMPSRCWG